MTRMIERWFPCQEVSDNSARGWGSGNSEVMLFPWFAKRPLAQAKAAVLTSLLPWPDDAIEQARLQDLVRNAMKGRDAENGGLVVELARQFPERQRLLDPFSGRAMIPLEAAHLAIRTFGVDYSPVAAVAGRLLVDYPLRDFSKEPELGYGRSLLLPRLPQDVEHFLSEVKARAYRELEPFYPEVAGKRPWGYLWSMTLPCQECGSRFPLIGSLTLRRPNPARDDAGQSLLLSSEAGVWICEVIDGVSPSQPTRVVAQGKSKYDAAGKVAVCLHCGHVHPKDVHTRLAADGLGEDVLLAVADNDEEVQRRFRHPTPEEKKALKLARHALTSAEPFRNGLPAIPLEQIPPGNTWTIQSTVYGAKTFADLCNPRQNLAFYHLARAIDQLSQSYGQIGVSAEYVAALAEYATSVLARRLKFSTRGARLRTPAGGVNVSDVFGNTESSWSFQYDYLETGLASGPGTWDSLAKDTISVLETQCARSPGLPAVIQNGSACSLPFADESMDAVVTDPPYDAMIDYTDASDLYYVWMKRALASANPEFSFTANPYDVQEKTDEIIVKKGQPEGDPRTPTHYDRLIARAFAEARRVVKPDGIVTIVFGHGDPDVWHRLLGAITEAGLVLTGSWPARTEKAKPGGGSNIVTTLTMACSPAPTGRVAGRASSVEAEVIREVKTRVQMWEQGGLAPTDQLMASAGPAMEVVGRYSQILNNLGEAVEAERYLLVARRAVEEAAAIEIDHLPLETFDQRTRFGLSWVRLYGRSIAPKSEARWQALASDLGMDRLKGILVDVAKGIRFSLAGEHDLVISDRSEVIDVALAMAKVWPEGLDAVGEVLAASQRDPTDPYLWAAISFLSSRLSEADPDATALTISRETEARSNQRSLFDVLEPNSEGIVE